jgi:hypothetical protein
MVNDTVQVLAGGTIPTAVTAATSYFGFAAWLKHVVAEHEEECQKVFKNMTIIYGLTGVSSLLGGYYLKKKGIPFGSGLMAGSWTPLVCMAFFGWYNMTEQQHLTAATLKEITIY